MVSGESKPSGLATWASSKRCVKAANCASRETWHDPKGDRWNHGGWCGCLITKKNVALLVNNWTTTVHIFVLELQMLQISSDFVWFWGFTLEQLGLSQHGQSFEKKGKRTRFTGLWLTNHLEKWWSSSMGRLTSHIWNGKKCLKPPSSSCFFPLVTVAFPRSHPKGRLLIWNFSQVQLKLRLLPRWCPKPSIQVSEGYPWLVSNWKIQIKQLSKSLHFPSFFGDKSPTFHPQGSVGNKRYTLKPPNSTVEPWPGTLPTTTSFPL